MAPKRAAPARGPIPTHPGRFLQEVVFPAVPQTIQEIAEGLQISRPQLYRVMKGEHPVSPELAVKLAAMFGNSAEMWMRMQIAHDLAIAEAKLAGQLAEIPRFQALDAA